MNTVSKLESPRGFRRAVTAARTLCLLLAASLTSGLPAVTPASADSPSVSVSPSSQTVSAGQNFTVAIVVNSSVVTCGAQVALGFDPTVLKANSVSEGTFYSSWDHANGATTTLMSGTIDNRNGTVSGTGDAIIGTAPGGHPVAVLS
jgi:adhesin HecA-like repeat protein